jgi:hypothetical protein
MQRVGDGRSGKGGFTFSPLWPRGAIIMVICCNGFHGLESTAVIALHYNAADPTDDVRLKVVCERVKRVEKQGIQTANWTEVV